jgi:hypothetical protein
MNFKDFKNFKNKVEEYMFFDKKTLAEILAMRDLKEEENSGSEKKSVFYCTAIDAPCLERNCSECLFGHIEQNLFVSTYTTTDKINFTQSM